MRKYYFVILPTKSQLLKKKILTDAVCQCLVEKWRPIYMPCGSTSFAKDVFKVNGNTTMFDIVQTSMKEFQNQTDF